MVRQSREHGQPKVTIRTGFEAKPCHLLSMIFGVGQRPSTIWKVGNNICHIEIYISTILQSEKYPMKFSILKIYQFFLSFFSFQQFQLCQLHQLSNSIECPTSIQTTICYSLKEQLKKIKRSDACSHRQYDLIHLRNVLYTVILKSVEIWPFAYGHFFKK